MKQHNKPIRHGEVMLVPVDELPTTTAVNHKTYIIGHSETGHHHVLESKTGFDAFLDEATQALYLELSEPAQLVHKKQVDAHKTLVVPAGRYRVVHKTEYDPWQQVIRGVFD